MPDKAGPGLCLAAAKIATPSILSPAQLFRWYDEYHIPLLMATGAFSSVIRAVTSDDNSAYPFVIIYAMHDVTFAKSDTFKSMVGDNIPINKDLLPGTGRISDMVEVDMRIYRRITNSHPDGKISADVKSICFMEGEPQEALSDAQSKEIFDANFVEYLKTLPISVHLERYRLVHEWWSGGDSLYNSEQLDFFGFNEPDPDYYGNFEKYLTGPGKGRLDDYSFEIKTFNVLQNKQAAEFGAK